jgi:hypothetical protein
LETLGRSWSKADTPYSRTLLRTGSGVAVKRGSPTRSLDDARQAIGYAERRATNHPNGEWGALPKGVSVVAFQRSPLLAVPPNERGAYALSFRSELISLRLSA